MKVKKYKFWLLFFFVIFGFTFGMIIWTVKSTINTPVYEDRSFLSSYHIVDADYNNIVENNKKFLNDYDIYFDINSNKVGLDISDVFLGRRYLEKSHKHKDFLKVGRNDISVFIKDKNNSNIVKNAKIELLLTRAIDSKEDKDIKSFSLKDNKYKTDIVVPLKGYWNLIGKVTIDKNTGYFFIKTNTKKKG
jgi:hypothetical protein